MVQISEEQYQESLALLKKLANRTGNEILDDDRYRKDLDRLTEKAEELYTDLESTVLKLNPVRNRRQTLFSKEYQYWYSEAAAFIGNVLPARLDEFISLYSADPKRKTVNARNYCISDWLLDISPYRRQDEANRCKKMVLDKFRMQIQILGSAKVRFESNLFDIETERKSERSALGNSPGIAQAMANVYLDIAIPALGPGYEEGTEERE